MNEKPILFNGPMVRAILEGRKTQTRRLIKPCPPGSEWVVKCPGDTFTNIFWNDKQWETQNIKVDSYCLCYTKQMQRYNPPTNLGKVEWYQWESSPFFCPYGQPGDRLWVRETWATPGNYDHIKPSDLIDTMCHEIVYRATELYPVYYNWRPSIHMPRWASRITLEITSVKVERLQDIDNHDSWREGIPEFGNWISNTGEARDEFARLWDSIYAKLDYSWGSNPLVWVVEFKKFRAA